MSEWYYAEGGEHRGPVSEEILRAKLAAGALRKTTLIWTSTMQEWAPASSLPAFAAGYGAVSEIETPEVDAAPRGYAGFWKRLLAIMVDGVVVGAPFYPMMWFIDEEAALRLMETVTPAQWIYVGTAYTLIGIIISWLYFAGFESSRFCATPGKLALGIRVLRDDGKKLGFGRASGRFFAKCLSYLSLFFGFVMAGFTLRKQALHDYVAGCIVTNQPRLAPIGFDAPYLHEAATEVDEITRVAIYGGFWRRAGALLIDMVITIPIVGLACVPFVMVQISSLDDFDPRTFRWTWNLVGGVIWWIYFVSFEWSPLQATPGKLALGIRVVNLQGNRLSFWRANGRYFSKYLTSFTSIFGYAMAGVTDRKQALHDRIASCLVVSKTSRGPGFPRV